MNSKKCQVRAVGQRSITSTFLFRAASNRSSSDSGKDVELKVHLRKGSRPTLSDFLNRKLHRSSVLPTSVVQGNELPFSSPSPISGDIPDKGAEGVRDKKEVGMKFSIDGAFGMFKNVERNKNSSCPSTEADIFYVDDDVQNMRKRRNPSKGPDDKPTARKRLVVLGEDSKPVQRSTGRKNEESIPLFNHYKNGGGWWNDNMEGVDNEEVGCNDVAWEGVGCTTLGGIEWH